MTTRVLSICALAGLLVGVLLAGCRTAPAAGPPPTATTGLPVQPSAAATATPVIAAATAAPVPAPATAAPSVDTRLVFASYQEPAVNVVPAVVQPPIAPDLSNVRVPVVLSTDQLARLGQDGFVVSPGTEKEFFTLYEKARYANVPIFITSDSLLHVYHLLFDKTLRTAETEYFIPLLRDLNQALLAKADAQYQELKQTGWEDAARRTVAYVAVGSKLLDPEVQVPAYAADLVDAELALIEAAAGIAPSPIFPGLEFGEDYTQYIPRGHYSKSDALKAYFKSMMWYGRMTFRLMPDKPEVGRPETRSALLLVSALRNARVGSRPALEAWADLYDPTVFFVGRSDDLTVLQYLPVIDEIYGENPAVTTLANDALLDPFIAEANKLPPPLVLGMVISDSDDVEETTKGLRFMGQRFVPDAYIFRQLIYRNVSTSEHRRGLPKGLDLPAAFGSERAYQILDEEGDTSYKNYPEQMSKMRSWVSGLTVEDWTETLYNAWLYSFQPLLKVPGQGYPAFMQSPAWIDKQLNTVLGSWAELKHDTILYAKQAYAEMGAGPPPPEPVPPRGYVEPVPEFYARLAALTAMTRAGLQDRQLLSEADGESLQQLYDLAIALQAMAEKELRNEALTDEEYTRIRFYGGDLEHLTMAAADTPEGEPGGIPYMDEEPQAAVVADIATDPDPDGDGIPNPAVLEEAVGRINPIHVVVPVVEKDGTVTLQVARGGVFAYYEFEWPADDRLTDEKWREMLDAGQAPPLPEWTASFMTTAGENSDLEQAVFSFEKGLVSAYWGASPESVPGTPDVQQVFAPEIEALRAQKQYEGRLLLGTTYRSFDRQSDNRAVVTVRETWQDSLYEGEFPDPENQPVDQRGPYTLDVTYTLERGEQGWGVTRVVFANQAPAW